MGLSQWLSLFKKAFDIKIYASLSVFHTRGHDEIPVQCCHFSTHKTRWIVHIFSKRAMWYRGANSVSDTVIMTEPYDKPPDC